MAAAAAAAACAGGRKGAEAAGTHRSAAELGVCVGNEERVGVGKGNWVADRPQPMSGVPVVVEMLLVVQVLAQPLILLPDASLLLGARSVVLAMSHSLLLLLLLLLRLPCALLPL